MDNDAQRFVKVQAFSQILFKGEKWDKRAHKKDLVFEFRFCFLRTANMSCHFLKCVQKGGRVDEFILFFACVFVILIGNS